MLTFYAFKKYCNGRGLRKMKKEKNTKQKKGEEREKAQLMNLLES